MKTSKKVFNILLYILGGILLAIAVGFSIGEGVLGESMPIKDRCVTPFMGKIIGISIGFGVVGLLTIALSYIFLGEK